LIPSLINFKASGLKLELLSHSSFEASGSKQELPGHSGCPFCSLFAIK